MQETGARVLIGFIEQLILPRLSALWLDAFTSRQALSRIAIAIADPSAAPQALMFEAIPFHSDEPVC